MERREMTATDPKTLEDLRPLITSMVTVLAMLALPESRDRALED